MYYILICDKKSAQRVMCKLTTNHQREHRLIIYQSTNSQIPGSYTKFSQKIIENNRNLHLYLYC